MSTITVLALIVVFSIGMVWAWFVDNDLKTSIITMHTGSLDLQCELFVGYDIDYDGTLEPLSYGTGESTTRSGKLASSYTPIASNITSSGDGINSHIELSGDSIVTYKLLIENNQVNNSIGLVTLSLANLQDYMFSNLNNKNEPLTDINNIVSPLAVYLKSLGTSNTTLGSLDAAFQRANFYNYIGNYVSRLMFKLNIIAIRTYAPDPGVNSLYDGYNTITASSSAGDGGAGVTLLPSIPAKPLYEISNGESVLSDYRVNIGELLEIEFSISGMQTDEIVAGYSAYLTNNALVPMVVSKITSNPDYDAILTSWQRANINDISKNFISEMRNTEFNYIFGRPNDSSLVKKLYFRIPKISVVAHSLPESSV